MIKSKTSDVRSMLLALGVGSYVADMAIPFVWFIPGSVDPDSAPIIEINKAMQRGLRKLGFTRVRVSGILDRETAAALNQISGSWMQKSFVQILGDILDAIQNPSRAALEGYFAGERPRGPLPGPLGMGAAGDGLAFGQGIRNKSNIVPIDSTADAAFKDLQRQINRLLSKVGKRIAEDGIIGRNTFRSFQIAQKVIGVSVPGDENTLEMARNAITIAKILRSHADALGISGGANRSTKVAKTETTKGAITPAQEKSFAGPMAAIKKYLPFLALAGVVAWGVSAQRRK